MTKKSHILGEVAAPEQQAAPESPNPDPLKPAPHPQEGVENTVSWPDTLLEKAQNIGKGPVRVSSLESLRGK